MMDRITVVVDTREQEPYSFDSDKVSAVRKALPAGDYSLVGLEERVAVERKSLTDLQLLQRPVAESANAVRIGRPAERVLELVE